MTTRKLLLALAVTISLLWHCESYTVRTKYGLLKGEQTQAPNGKDVKEFLGVPYAKPPLGEFRFKYPMPPEPWNGVKEALSWPNTCMQRANSVIEQILKDYAPFRRKSKVSEDCLYLNMWIPDTVNTESSKIPVMIFFHGGAFFFGSISADGYNGGVLATEENVIMVTVGYRLASLGFLSLDDEEVPGNAGLVDQQMAMRWVSENVASFGGDPNRVTIIGQSAGSASVNFHLLVPSSWDYFQGAILQSGTFNNLWSLNQKENNDESGWKLAEFAGCKNETVKETVTCLQSLDAEEIILNEPIDGYFFLVFAPTIDGVYLKESPQDLYRQGKVKQCNIISGGVKDDGSFFVPVAIPEYIFPLATNPKPNYEAIKALLKTDPNHHLHPTILKTAEYIYTGLEINNDPDYVLKTLISITTDAFFVCSTKELLQPYQKQSSNNKVRVYSYLYTHRLSCLLAEKWLGVYHATDLPMTFGMGLNTFKNRLLNCTPLAHEVTLTKRMLRYLGNFARTGNPNISPSGKMVDIQWPEYTVANEEYLILAPNSTKVGWKYSSKACKYRNELLPYAANELKLPSKLKAKAFTIYAGEFKD